MVTAHGPQKLYIYVKVRLHAGFLLIHPMGKNYYGQMIAIPESIPAECWLKIPWIYHRVITHFQLWGNCMFFFSPERDGSHKFSQPFWTMSN